VPPTVPELGGGVVAPLLPLQAAKRRDEASSAAEVEDLVFTGCLSIGHVAARYVDPTGLEDAGCVLVHLI
jgi:hypothetical protein